MKKKALLLALILAACITLCACDTNQADPFANQLFGGYRSLSDGTVMQFDSMLYYLTEDDVYILNYKYNPNTGELFLGDQTFSYSYGETRKTLYINSEEYENIGFDLGVTWRIVKACAEVYIGDRGVVGWLLSPMVYQGTNTLGIYGLGLAALVDIGIIIVIITLVVTIGKIANRDKKAKRRR